jgi:hypothetical protein
MPSLEGFILAFLENIYQDNNVELLQGNVATRLDAEKLKDASSRVCKHEHEQMNMSK